MVVRLDGGFDPDYFDMAEVADEWADTVEARGIPVRRDYRRDQINK